MSHLVQEQFDDLLTAYDEAKAAQEQLREVLKASPLDVVRDVQMHIGAAQIHNLLQ